MSRTMFVSARWWTTAVILTLLIGAGARADSRGDTLIVAADNSTADGKAGADYVCDGTDDEVEINAALQALPAGGGQVVLLEGTYEIDDTIVLDAEYMSLRFNPGAEVRWTGVSGSAPLIALDASNTYLHHPNVRGSGSGIEGFREGIGILVGMNNTVHGCQIYAPRCRLLQAGIEFGIVGTSSSGDNNIWGGRIDRCDVGIRSRGFVNRVYGPFISFCGIGIHCTADRSSQKIEVFGATINQWLEQAVWVERGKDSYFADLWMEHTDESLTPTEVVRIGSSTYEVVNCTFAGNTNVHTLNEDYALHLVRSKGLRFESMLISTNDPGPSEAIIYEAATNTGGNNRVGRIAFYPGVVPTHTVLEQDGSGEVIVQEVPDVPGRPAGSTVGNAPAPGEADYLIARQATGSDVTYFAKARNGHVAVVSENLKTVFDVIKAENTFYQFTSGAFDFGTIAAANERLTFLELDGLRIEGAGIGKTFVTNTSSISEDTEVFSFTRCNRVELRHLTVEAGGPLRTTSDAIDLDDGSHSIIEQVEVTGSRGSGVFIDGKDTGAVAQNNRIVNCRVTGCQRTGIVLLAADYTDIVNCAVWGNTVHGIQVDKASTTAGQANKKSTHNKISGGHVYENGEHGIYIRSSDGTIVSGVSVRNNGSGASSRDGIRVTTANSTTAVGNVIGNCVVTDEQSTKTQTYGVRILPSSGNVEYTIVGDNFLRGNQTGSLSDAGLNTQASNNAQ